MCVFQSHSSVASQAPAETEKKTRNTPWTDKLSLLRPEDKSEIPVYKVLDKNGGFINSLEDPQVYISIT